MYLPSFLVFLIGGALWGLVQWKFYQTLLALWIPSAYSPFAKRIIQFDASSIQALGAAPDPATAVLDLSRSVDSKGFSRVFRKGVYVCVNSAAMFTLGRVLYSRSESLFLSLLPVPAWLLLLAQSRAIGIGNFLLDDLRVLGLVGRLRRKYKMRFQTPVDRRPFGAYVLASFIGISAAILELTVLLAGTLVFCLQLTLILYAVACVFSFPRPREIIKEKMHTRRREMIDHLNHAISRASKKAPERTV